MKTSLSELFQIFCGVGLASIGLKAFLLPNGFLDGGVTGIAILISELTGIDVSILLVLISIPFLVMAWFLLSKGIVYKSVLAILTLAIIIHFENFQSITEDKLLIAIFGGLFLGAGIGLAIKNGAFMDGSEALGVFVNDRYGISIGKVILVFNVVLFAITAVLLSVEIAMYSVLTYIVTAKVIDFWIEGFEDFVGIMIVTKKTVEMERMLIENVGAGITLFNNVSGYGNSGLKENQVIIQTVINRIDIRKTHNVINSVDDAAFIIEFDLNNIKGGVHRRYLSQVELSKLSPELFKK